MRNNQLKIGDFIYPQEIPVRTITLLAAAIILVIVFIFNIYMGLFFILNIGLLFLALYQMAVSTLGSCVKVGPAQFPNVYRLAQIAAERLNMDIPAVYIMQNPIMNAYATGFWGNYFVVLHSSIVDALTEDELLATIGHEFTHIKGNHVIITNLTMGGVGLLKVVWWLQTIIKYVFLFLMRCQEYTCDRGGLIACGSIQAVVTENVKFSIGKDLFNKIDIMEFYKQALELDRMKLGILGEVESTHPLTVKRIRQAVRFYRSEKYQRIASMMGKMGTSTLQGSLATGDLMQKIVNKAQGKPVNNSLNFEQKYNQNQHDSIQPFQMISNGNEYQSNSIRQSLGFCKRCGSPKKEGLKMCPVCGTLYTNKQDLTKAATIYEDNVIPVLNVDDSSNIAEYSGIHINDTDRSEQEIGYKICPRCSQKNNKDALFCNECGEKI